MRRHALSVVGAALLLTGCSAVGSLTGAVVGAASGAASASPAVGVAVGIGVQAAMDASIATALRYWSHQEQQQIASLVGTMAVGQQKAWAIRHSIPYGNEQGNVTVVRAFETPLASCKEAVFSVDGSGAKKSAPPPNFTTTICKGETEWQWASAEPAVGRWGALQ